MSLSRLGPSSGRPRPREEWGLQVVLAGGAEGSFLCSLSSRFSGRGGRGGEPPQGLAASWGLLPLDEVPVHVPLRRPRPLRFERLQCQCGIHRAEAASALRSRKTERAAKEKPTPISQIF